jgi:DNA-binding transcriptional regulator LsrR (DeoR family)
VEWEEMTKERKLVTVLQLRLDGRTYSEISEICGISRATAWRMVQEALKINLRTDVEVLRARQLEDLNKAKAKLFEKSVWSGKDALGFVALLQHEARIYGLDLPEKVVVEQKSPQTDQEFLAFLGGLAELISTVSPDAQDRIDGYLRAYYGSSAKN